MITERRIGCRTNLKNLLSKLHYVNLAAREDNAVIFVSQDLVATALRKMLYMKFPARHVNNRGGEVRMWANLCAL